MAMIHGGDTESFLLQYGYSPLDFSANMNPLGVPDGVNRAICRYAAEVSAYPDPLCRRLRDALSGYENVPSERILCGNGSADLIYRLVLALKPRRAVVTAPAFAEYEKALDTVGCRTRRYLLGAENGFRVTETLFEAITPDLDLLFICNPNNPTGHTVEPGLLERLLHICAERGVTLMIDECFGGFLDEPDSHSMKKYLSDFNNLIILNAFTKLYAMAGIRLGYCMSGDTALLERMKEAGQPWAVSSLAQVAGIAALGECDYVSAARSLIQKEREILRAGLSAFGITVLGGEANYLFFRSDRTDLSELLLLRGIMIRDCSNYAGLEAGYYRVAVRCHEDNIRLLDAIGESVLKTHCL